LIPLAIMLIVYIFAFITALLQKDYISVFIIMLFVLIILAVLVFGHFLQKGRYGRKTNKTVIFSFSLGMSLIAVIFIALIVIFTGSGKSQNLSAGLVSSSGTFLASTETYDFPFDNDDEEDFTIFRSNYSFIINQYVYSEKHIFFMNDSEKISLPEWGAKETFTVNSNRKTYVVYDNYVISFDSDKNIIKAYVEQTIK